MSAPSFVRHGGKRGAWPVAAKALPAVGMAGLPAAFTAGPPLKRVKDAPPQAQNRNPERTYGSSIRTRSARLCGMKTPRHPPIMPPQTLVHVLVKSLAAGALIGAAQGLVGYFPHPNFVFMAVSAALVGAVVAAIFGVSLYSLFFRHTDALAALRSVAWVSGVCGVLASLAIRWWTRGEGAVLSMFVTPVVALIAAAAVRGYIRFGSNK